MANKGDEIKPPEAAGEVAVEEVKKVEDLRALPQTPEHRRAAAGLRSDIKVPSDLSKVSNAKAKELADAGLVDDADLPGKMYRRKADGFTTRIPNYIYEAYTDYHKEEWEEVKLTSDATSSSES